MTSTLPAPAIVAVMACHMPICTSEPACKLAGSALSGQRADLVRIVIVDQVRFALLFDQNAAPGQQLHHPRDDLVHHRLHRFIGRRGYLDELWLTVGIASVNSVQGAVAGIVSFARVG